MSHFGGDGSFAPDTGVPGPKFPVDRDYPHFYSHVEVLKCLLEYALAVDDADRWMRNQYVESQMLHWPVRMPRGSCRAGAERRRMPRGSGQCRGSKGIGPLGRRARVDAPPEKGRQGVESGKGRTRCPSEGGNAAPAAGSPSEYHSDWVFT